jgi:hypothetical protein
MLTDEAQGTRRRRRDSDRAPQRDGHLSMSSTLAASRSTADWPGGRPQCVLTESLLAPARQTKRTRPEYLLFMASVRSATFTGTAGTAKAQHQQAAATAGRGIVLLSTTAFEPRHHMYSSDPSIVIMLKSTISCERERGAVSQPRSAGTYVSSCLKGEM